MTRGNCANVFDKNCYNEKYINVWLRCTVDSKNQHKHTNLMHNGLLQEFYDNKIQVYFCKTITLIVTQIISLHVATCLYFVLLFVGSKQ
uniref:Uncharacterized protein n=1 Tax=Glossina palpalis gambiensis TaxID=67801 RepID=A0A1B0AS87_9MUSC